jgi:molybdenum cofactor cytidylyltransferase
MNAIVLAAGFSRRFGSPKQLFELDGEPLVRRAARTAAEVAKTIVVIPCGVPAIRDALSGLDIVIVENGGAAEGMASSIRAGVTASSGDVLLLVCDQPGVTAEHLRALTSTGASLAASGYNDGTFGVPAFFAAEWREELLSLRADRGARRVLNEHRDQLAVVPLARAEDWDVRPSMAPSWD